MNFVKIQTIDTSWVDIKETLLNSTFTGYEIPKNQTLECAWDFRLYSSKEIGLVFCSEVTSFGGWEEIGVLKISAKEVKNIDRNPEIYTFQEIENFIVSDVLVLESIDGGNTVECGIKLINTNKEQLLITTSPAPGAVSIDACFSNDKFNPEVSLEFCNFTNN